MRIQRRRFIKHALTSFAVAGVPLLSRSFASGNTDKKIAIVGAGIAGLNCAYVLKKNGLQADIFEATDRVGGRMYTLRGHFSQGLTFELGGEWINKGHSKMLGLAAELGLQVDDLFASGELSFETRSYFFQGQHYTPSDLALRFAPLAQAMKSAAAAASDSEAHFDALDAMSIDEWLNTQSDTDKVVRSVIENAYLSEFGLDTDRSSILNLLFLMDFEKLNPFRLQGESNEGFHIQGGSDLVTSKLASLLASQIATSTALTSVCENPTKRLELRFAQSDRERVYDHVVLAIPFSVLRQLDVHADLSPMKRQAINQLSYGSHVKICAEFKEKVWRNKYGASGYSFSDTPLQVTWESSVGQNTSAGLLTNIRGGSSIKTLLGLSEEQVVSDVTTDMNKIFPGLDSSFTKTSAMKFWDNAPFAKGSYSGCGPGQWKWAGVAKKRHNNIHFAGEHCSIDNQGYMEGACESGEEAALAILGDLGMRPIRPYSSLIFSNRAPSFRALKNRVLQKRIAAMRD